MEPAIYLKQWLALRETSSLKDDLYHLSRNVAFSFIDRYYQKSCYVPEYIDLLCEMATSFSQPHLNNIAAAALFEIIVEQICDDYEYMPVEIYSRVMSQVITHCRNNLAGTILDKQLTDFGLLSFDDIHKRAELVHSRKYFYDINKTPEKIILLSRITIGADVAILSVMIKRLMNMFPHTQIVIIGSDKLTGIFGGNAQVRIRRLNYARRGGLFERFSSWYSALDILSDEMPPESEDNVLLIDSDSRISQLGVLPLTHRDNYLFFNSRKCLASSKNSCMAELTNYWMDAVFGKSEFCFPRIWTPPSIENQAAKIINCLRTEGCKNVVAVNLGVGGNPRKRLGIDFEKKLLMEILKTPGTVVLLDKGFGEEELSLSASLLTFLQQHGFQAVSGNFNNSSPPRLSHGVAALDCTIGEIASLIALSDEYIGYDSACQHIAAAAQTPTLTIFAGTNNMEFIRRWSACGNTKCSIIHVNTIDHPGQIDNDEVIVRVIEERNAIIKKHPKQPKILEIRTPSPGKAAVKKTSKSATET
jgi:hypothetical protein